MSGSAAPGARIPWYLPAAWLLVPLLAPLAFAWRHGPMFELGAGSARYLELWSVLTLAAEIAVVVPATKLAYRALGWSGAAAALVWLGAVAAFAYHRGIWYS